MFGLLNPPWTRRELLASGGLVALVLLLGLAGDGVRDALAWNRAAIDAGQWWRLLTGHLVHLGAGHLLLDLTGLVLLLLFFRDVFSPRDWLLAGLAGAALVSAGLWWLDPGVRGYVGISGVLHTWLFAGLLLSLRHTPLINGIVLAAMVWRLWTEQQPDYDAAYMQSFIGGSVLVNAHLYGALAALPVTALLWRHSQARQARFRALDRGEAAGPS